MRPKNDPTHRDTHEGEPQRIVKERAHLCILVFASLPASRSIIIGCYLNRWNDRWQPEIHYLKSKSDPNQHCHLTLSLYVWSTLSDHTQPSDLEMNKIWSALPAWGPTRDVWLKRGRTFCTFGIRGVKSSVLGSGYLRWTYVSISKFYSMFWVPMTYSYIRSWYCFENYWIFFLSVSWKVSFFLRMEFSRDWKRL